MTNVIQKILLTGVFAGSLVSADAAVPLVFLDDSYIGFSGDINYFGITKTPGEFGEAITTITETTTFNFVTFQEEPVTTLSFNDGKNFNDVGGLNFEDSTNIGVSSAGGTFQALGFSNPNITEVDFHNFQFDTFNAAEPLWEAWVNRGVTNASGKSLETYVKFNFTELDVVDRDSDSLELHGKGTLVYDLSDVANGYYLDGEVTATWSYTSQAGFTFSTGTIVDEDIVLTSGRGAVPEPSTYAMFGTALLILGVTSYRKRRAS